MKKNTSENSMAEEERDADSAINPQTAENGIPNARDSSSRENVPETSIYKPVIRDLLAQILACCIIHCIVIEAGINMAYGTIVNDQLKKNDTGIQIENEDEASWIASLSTITVPIGSSIVGPLMDRFGRQRICHLSVTMTLISWILIIFAKSLPIIYAARVISGFATGLTTVGVVYVSEITHPQIRQMLLCFNSIFVSLGITLTFIFGAFLSWKTMAIVCLVLYLFIFLALFYVPESPHWLLNFGNKKNKENRMRLAETSLKRLNPNSNMFEYEREKLRALSETSKSSTKTTRSKADKLQYYKKEMSSPKAYKPIAILVIIFTLQQLSGAYVIIMYAMSILVDIGNDFGNGLNKNNASVILGVLRFSVSVATALFSKKLKRRTLMTCSGIGMSIAMFLSSLSLFLSKSSIDNDNFFMTLANDKLLRLILYLMYVSFCAFGFSIIPWTLIGEMLPISLRATCGGLLVSYAYVAMFLVTKFYPKISNFVGVEVTFLFFAVMSLVETLYVRICLPETLGKSLDEVGDYFEQKKRR